MILKDAIKRAGAFSSKEHPYVHFTAADNAAEFPATVSATNGEVTCTCFCDLDVQLPTMRVDADQLVGVVKQLKGEEFFIERAGASLAVVKGLSVVTHVQGGDAGGLQRPAGWPVYRPVHRSVLEQIRRVSHCVAKDVAREKLRFIRIAGGFAEASDQYRAARVRYSLPGGLVEKGVLVPTGLFGHWPKKANGLWPQLAVHAQTLFLHLGDELRTIPVQGDEGWFDLSLTFPEQAPPGNVARVNPDVVKQAVTFGKTASAQDLVALDFTPGKLTVCGIDMDGRIVSTVEAIDVPSVMHPYALRLVVNGKLLQTALAEFDCPEVDLRYTASDSPLRLEDGTGYVEVIWPLVAGQPG